VVELELTSQAPFEKFPVTAAAGRGVIAVDRDGMGIAAVLARKGRMAALTQRIRERFDIELPLGCRRAEAFDIAFAAIGPETWLATHKHGGNAFSAALKDTIGDLACVADQSDGYAVLGLTGPRLRDMLAKLLPIDLHPKAFRPGDVASTIASYIGVIVWRMSDAGDGAPVFEIAVPRSFTGSFWQELTGNAAEYGMVIESAVTC
jgi:heterotetrameric sarcosine oxidase gamma subunit